MKTSNTKTHTNVKFSDLRPSEEVETPTKDTAQRVVKVLSFGLSCGLGRPRKGQMCVEAAVNYAMGLPHNDKPDCVHPDVRDFKIQLNDLKWSSKQARAQGLKRVAIAQLGSDMLDGDDFNELLSKLLFTEILLPKIKEVVDKELKKKNKGWDRMENDEFSEYQRLLKQVKTLLGLKSMKSPKIKSKQVVKLNNYLRDLGGYNDEFDQLQHNLINKYPYPTELIENIPDCFKITDKLLSKIAECAVKVLKQLKSPGCQWLYLAK